MSDSDDSAVYVKEVILVKKTKWGKRYFSMRQEQNVLDTKEGRPSDDKSEQESLKMDSTAAAKAAFKSALNNRVNKGYKVESISTKAVHKHKRKKDSSSSSSSHKKHKAKDNQPSGTKGKKTGYSDVFSSDSDADQILNMKGHVFSDASASSSSDDADGCAKAKAKTKKQQPCKYGMKCLRTNPAHFKAFAHPDGFVVPKTKNKNKNKTNLQSSSSSSKPAKASSSKKTKSDNQVFKNMVICFTGGLGMVRAEASRLVCKYGGRVNKSVTKTCTHVVTPDPDASSAKLSKAEDIGLTIHDEEWFNAKLDEAKAAGSDSD